MKRPKQLYKHKGLVRKKNKWISWDALILATALALGFGPYVLVSLLGSFKTMNQTSHHEKIRMISSKIE